MRLEMIRELQNALAQNRYLNFWRPGIGLVDPIFCDYVLALLQPPVPCSNRYSSSYLNLFLYAFRIPYLSRSLLN